MRHIALAIFIVLALAGLALFVVTHENIAKEKHLVSELERLSNENRKLQESNDALKRRIRALKDDPRLAERRARADANLVKEDEIVFQFVDKEKTQTVAVILSVSNSSATLAGRPVSEDNFKNALEKLKHDVPGAALKVNFDPDLDPIRKQFFEDAIQSKSFKTLP